MRENRLPLPVNSFQNSNMWQVDCRFCDDLTILVAGGIDYIIIDYMTFLCIEGIVGP